MKSLDQMIDTMHMHARHVLIGKPDEQIAPFFHIQFKDRPDVIMPAPFSSKRDKSLFLQAMRMPMQRFRPSIENYAFVSEAWVAAQTHRPRKGDLTPSQREDKRECVIVCAADHDGATMRVWEIVRDDKGRVTDLVEDKRMEGDNFEGRLHNLLADED